MARAFINKITNDHPKQILNVEFPAQQHPADKDTRAALASPISVPPGGEIEIDGLLVPWGNEGQLLAYTDQVNWMKLVVHDGNDKGQAWDFIHVFDKSNKEVHRLDAGSLGDVWGTNYSWWELKLDEKGRQNLICQTKQGLDFHAAVATIVSICIGVPALLVGAGAALAGAGLAVFSGGASLVGVLAGAGATAAGASVAAVAWTNLGIIAGTVAACSGIFAAGAGLIAAGAGVVGTAAGIACGLWGTLAPKGDGTFQFKRKDQPHPPDVAAGKPSTASSYLDVSGSAVASLLGGGAANFYSAGRANDGRDGGPGGWLPADSDTQSFWQVDLGNPTSLSVVMFFALQDVDIPESRCNFAIEGIYVDGNGSTSVSVLGEVKGEAGPHQGALMLMVTDPTPFRYIRARKTKPGRFGIAALQAYARPVDLARGKQAAASSEYDADHTASRANQGGRVAASGWSPSAADKNSFWQVDLGQSMALGRIELLTRQDLDQAETRQDFAIWASNNADMSQGHTVLGVRGSRPLGYRDTFVVDIDDPTPYRYVAVVKPKPGYFFIANLAVYGRPQQPHGSYTIVSGDTLGDIAARFGCSLNDLLSANPQITNPDLIYAGQILQVPGMPPAAVAAASAGGNLTVIGTDHRIYSWSGSNWVGDSVDGAGTNIAVGGAGQLYLLNANAGNTIWRRDPGGWSQVPGAALDIAVSSDGTLYVIGTDNCLYRWNGSGWEGDAFGATGTRVAAGPEGQLYLLNANAGNTIWRRDAGGWSQLAGAALDIAVSGDGTLYVIGTDHGLYRWNGSGWDGDAFGAAGTRVAAGPGNQVYVLNANAGNTIWRREQGGWIQLPGAALAFCVTRSA